MSMSSVPGRNSPAGAVSLRSPPISRLGEIVQWTERGVNWFRQGAVRGSSFSVRSSVHAPRVVRGSRLLAADWSSYEFASEASAVDGCSRASDPELSNEPIPSNDEPNDEPRTTNRTTNHERRTERRTTNQEPRTVTVSCPGTLP